MAKAILLKVCELALAGCGNEANLDGKLGGSEASFVESHGPNQQDEDAEGLTAIFDYMSESGTAATFIQDHAVFLLISLSNEENSGLTLEEALDYTEEFIPEDAELVEEGEPMQNMIYIYESSLLHEAVGGEDTDTQTFSIRFNADGEDNYTAAQIQTDQINEEE